VTYLSNGDTVFIILVWEHTENGKTDIWMAKDIFSPIISDVPNDFGDTNLFELNQNYPNPFNPSTIIKYFIPKNEKRETIKVKLVIYDILGKEVSVLVNENQKPGNYEVEIYPYAQGLNLSSGIYYYRIMTDTYSKTRKMILIK
jgi:hypothetical protein